MEDNQNNIIVELQEVVEKCIEEAKADINKNPFEFVGFIDGGRLTRYRGI